MYKLNAQVTLDATFAWDQWSLLILEICNTKLTGKNIKIHEKATIIKHLIYASILFNRHNPTMSRYE